MRCCEIDNVVVDCSTLSVDFHSFGKELPQKYALPYCLTVEFADAVERFSDFYQSFLEREAEDEGFEDIVEGDYLFLRETGYLPFDQMLVMQPDLLGRVILKLLPSEFMGYLFRNCENTGRPAFILQTLTSVEIGGGCVSCKGAAFYVEH